MSGYSTVYDWLNSDEIMDHSSPEEALEFFRNDEAASVESMISKDYTIFLDTTMVTTKIVNDILYGNTYVVRGFSRNERESIDMNTELTMDLYNAICASASRARTH